MIDFDSDNFEAKLSSYDDACNGNTLQIDENELDNSTGIAINKINSFIDSYDEMINNINDLFSSSSSYFHKVLTNINDCEEENSFNSIDI
ncbi:MAG: hypothetical protein J6U54_02970 [Clostridiales bacterium]|nr:hypothetical protein [Clostridiales bacterium]